MKDERLVAGVHAHLDRWSPNGLPSLRYFGLPSAQPLRRLALMDPTDRYLRAWKPVPQFNHYSPSSNGRLSPPSWRNEKPWLRSYSLKPNLMVTREGSTERKTALEATGNTTIRLR